MIRTLSLSRSTFFRTARLVALILLSCGFTAVPGSQARERSALAPPPDWSELSAYARTLTADQLRSDLDAIYAPGGTWQNTISISKSSAIISTAPSNPFGKSAVLPLAMPGNPAAASEKAPRFWRRAAELPPAGNPARPLEGVRIAIDPGHIGGKWARREERWFQIGNAKPVMEGDMVLRVARHLSTRLTKLGARVTLVRRSNRPVARLRPTALESIARELLADQGVQSPAATYTDNADPERRKTVQWQTELLSYRNQEIRARAERVNDRIQPDLVVCLHFNAEAWGDPRKPELVDKNHLHLLVNGACSAEELQLEDVRFDIVKRIAQRIHPEEVALADSVARSMATATGLPKYEYTGNNAIPVGSTFYVWARNLIANRLYECPVIFIEPYVMNSREVFERVQAGDYKGLRAVAGSERKSIYREYADSVADGLEQYFRTHRPK